VDALPQALANRDGAHGLRPRTVIWLNELQLFPDPADMASGEHVAASLRELLGSSRARAVLVLGTLGRSTGSGSPPSRSQKVGSARPDSGTVGGRDLRVDDFDGRDATVVEAAEVDPRWEPLDSGSGWNRNGAQQVAGAPPGERVGLK
jgi:hypothetical protein